MYGFISFSYTAYEIMLHFFREDAEESPFINELITRQLNETQWVGNLVVGSTIHTTKEKK